MSIASAIQAAQQKIANAYAAISSKGGTLPATQDLANMPTAINSIDTTNFTSLSVTPSTTAQTLTPVSPYNGFNQVDVSAVTSSIDANITAGNIKKDVQILGVTGTYEGSGGSKYFGCDGTTFIGEIDANGTLQAPFDSSYIDNIVFTGVKDIGKAGLAAKFNNEATTGGSNVAYTRARSRHVKNISFPDLISISGENALYSFCNSQNSTLTNVSFPKLGIISGQKAMQYAFQRSALTSMDLSSLTTVSGSSALSNAFSNCTSLTSMDLSSLTTVSGSSAISNAFSGCTSLTSVDLSSLTTVSGSNAMQSAFQYSKLTSVDLSSLTTVSGSNALSSIFASCTSLTSVDLSSLASIADNSVLASAFTGTRLTTLSFPSLTSASFGSYNSQFNNMLIGVKDCTVHFPSNLQSVIGSWSSVTAGFGGTNTTVLFDLPATT